MIFLSSFKVVCIKSWLAGMFPKLRKTQLTNLTLGVFGLIKARSGLMSVIVREVPGSLKHKHRLKRFWRFVSNPGIQTGQLQLLWCRWVISAFMPGKYLAVALDWTTLPGNIQLLMVSVPYAGRAIPLLWVTTTYRAFKDSQNRIEERLISSLTQIIPQEKRIILIADRGFGRASLVNFLIKLDILFVLRVKADVIITTRGGRKINLRKLNIKAGRIKWFDDIAYRADGRVDKVNLAVTLAEPKLGEKEDPWLLVTNLRTKDTAIQNYKLRFDIEEWFRDLKTELGINDLQTKNLDRVRRLVLISSIAYGLLMLVGTVTKGLTRLHDILITGGKKVASRIWFALRIIQYQLLPSIYWKKIWSKALGP